LSGEFLKATHPHGTGDDSHYQDGSGISVVTYYVPLSGIDPDAVTLTATLYYQSIPPYYLKMRFEQAPDYSATKRLYYLARISRRPERIWRTGNSRSFPRARPRLPRLVRPARPANIRLDVFSADSSS